MKQRIKYFWLVINLPRTFPAIVIMFLSKSKDIIFKDIERWISIKNPNITNSKVSHLNWLMLTYPEFRNLFYLRIKKHNFIISQLLKMFYKPLSSLYIYTEEIGEGLFIQHGFSTIIIAKRIGKNCSINQQVTIGYGNTGTPTIGDNVLIASGAKVFGDIVIKENSKIGANCVISKNVPSNCTVVGIPGKIVKRNGERVDIAL